MNTFFIVATIVLSIATVVLVIISNYYRRKVSDVQYLECSLQIELIDLVRDYLFKEGMLEDLDSILQIKRKSLRDIQNYILSQQESSTFKDRKKYDDE
jgi:hypothetical protein